VGPMEASKATAPYPLRGNVIRSCNRVETLRVGVCLALAWAFLSLGCSGVVSDQASKVDAGEEETGSEIATFADAGPAASACLHYYAAQDSRCGGPLLPASEGARQRARFVQVCLNDIALPGSGMTIAAVEACASALDLSACELPEGPPVACNFNGSLPGGAPCNEGLQCQSGMCQGTAFLSPEGPIGPSTCGTCAPFVQTGQVCAHQNFTGGCANGQVCLIGAGMETAATPTYTCVPIAEGDAGASCDGLSKICPPGLYCSATTGRCQALGDAGASCGEGMTPPGNPGGCSAPLSCVGDPGMATCALGAMGSFCLGDSDCSPGLGCVPGPCAPSGSIVRFGCAESGTCQPVTWASPGQTCDSYRTRCLVGPCGGSAFGPPLPSVDGGPAMGTCPAIASDGQPCGSECDVFAECFSSTGKAGGTTALMGTCTLLDSVACR
jgi:hypothetical protein